MRASETQQSEAAKATLRGLRRAPMWGVVAVVVAALWEHGSASQYSATTTGTIIEFTRAAQPCSRCDSTPPRISYEVEGRPYSVVVPRAVFDVYRFDDVGDAVPLCYDPDRPEEATIDLPWYRYPVTSTLVVLTALVAGVAAWSLTFGRRKLLRRIEAEQQRRLARR